MSYCSTTKFQAKQWEMWIQEFLVMLFIVKFDVIFSGVKKFLFIDWSKLSFNCSVSWRKIIFGIGNKILVQSCSVLYNAVRSLKFDGWHFTHLWKSLAWPHHFTKSGGLDPWNSLAPPIFIEVLVPSQKSEQSCVCELGIFILPHSTILVLDFGTFTTVWNFCSFYWSLLYKILVHTLYNNPYK